MSSVKQGDDRVSGPWVSVEDYKPTSVEDYKAAMLILEIKKFIGQEAACRRKDGNYASADAIERVGSFIDHRLKENHLANKAVNAANIDKSIATSERNTLQTNRANFSDKLVKMIQASARFWENADRNDRGTHPDNRTVAVWLEENGFDSTPAKHAASLIRPDWAPTGRKPEE